MGVKNSEGGGGGGGERPGEQRETARWHKFFKPISFPLKHYLTCTIDRAAWQWRGD